jgi:hypothetical protein
MKSVLELNDTELRQAYVYATRRYNDAYREKKQLEDEMFRRYERELEANRE